MNSRILDTEVQHFIDDNLSADTGKLSLSRSVFEGVSPAELATQIISKKKAEKKLPAWFNTKDIYYPKSVSVEQCSSEATASFKAGIPEGKTLLDITAGFGVDAGFFAQRFEKVTACEIDEELSAISEYNARKMQVYNIRFVNGDGITWLKNSEEEFDVIYGDPARRNSSGKVFKLADCAPDIIEHLPLLLRKAKTIMIKTSPFLDLSAGLSELLNVSGIYILSVKNDCKEVLWVMGKEPVKEVIVYCITINSSTKSFSYTESEADVQPDLSDGNAIKYLYEPDAALLKSGAFNLIGNRYGLNKLHTHSHLYEGVLCSDFPGRIFEVKGIILPRELKKLQGMKANVIVRNYPGKAEDLAKKYKLSPSNEEFLLFTELAARGHVIFLARIIQHY